jgi:hypothetical protein
LATLSGTSREDGRELNWFHLDLLWFVDKSETGAQGECANRFLLWSNQSELLTRRLTIGVECIYKFGNDVREKIMLAAKFVNEKTG